MPTNNYPLVSLITPCYNGEEFIGRLLESVLNQSYPCIEYFIIDDGSTDNSASIIESYIPKFKEKGYSLIYKFQPNSGQSVAINKALKLINGVYLLWPDCDDYYMTDETIMTLYNELISLNDDYAMVRCFISYIDERGILYKKHSVSNVDISRTNLFQDALLGENNFWYPPGGYMIKFDKLKKVLPSLEIFTLKEAGQNFQLLFPILYNYKCKTIPQYLYTVYERKDSHSRGVSSSFDAKIRMLNVYLATANSTIRNIANISESDCKYYTELYLHMHNIHKYHVCVEFSQREEAWNNLKRIIRFRKAKFPLRLFLSYLKHFMIKPILVYFNK